MTATTGPTPSNVTRLENAVRRKPLEDAPRNRLIDALQTQGMKLRAARLRADDVRGEGLARLLDSNARLARKVRDELRRTATYSHPEDGPRRQSAPVGVVRGRARPRFVGGWGQPSFSESVNSESNWAKDRVEVGALYLLGLLRRLAKPSTRPTRR